MAGHSKWKNIKHKKEREDAKKNKVFTRLGKEIQVVARDGGPDPATNARLRFLIDKAKDSNVPKDNIERAIKKGSGQLEGCNLEQITYEGYGINGSAVIIEAFSDNKNRTASELRHYFNKNGGSLAENGAVTWMFDHKGLIEIATQGRTEDQILELLLDCPVDDVKFEDDELVQVYCPVKELDHVRKQVEATGLKIKSLQIVWVAKEQLQFETEELENATIDFLEGLEDLDDVQNVFTNF